MTKATSQSGRKLSELAVIVLAAGKASRFGSPKQLAFFGDRTLLSIALTHAKKISERVVLVTGAYAEEVESSVVPGVEKIRNPHWQTGMGSSIKVAIDSLATGVDGAMILLADQPLITESHLRRLVDCWRGSSRLNRPWAVATQYPSSLGVPALFDRKAFDDLIRLEGDQGARALLNTGAQGIKVVEPDFSLVDIDTSQQLENLIAQREKP